MLSPSTGDRDAFEHYLQDVGRYPLIRDQAEERELARRARRGDEEAAERLVTANLRFVVSYVKRYRGRGIEFDDLVCLGNQGLLQAVGRFDPERGVRFLSYAVWWIRQTVLQGIADQGRSVRIPVNQHVNLGKLAHAEARLAQSLGRRASDGEVASEMSESPDSVRALRRVKAQELRLDAPLTGVDRSSGSVGERFAPDHRSAAEAGTDARACRTFLERMLELYLTPRERKVLYLYYGLDGSGPSTLQEIGVTFGVTRERIRQIRNRAFEKLRSSPDGEALAGFWLPN